MHQIQKVYFSTVHSIETKGILVEDGILNVNFTPKKGMINAIEIIKSEKEVLITKTIIEKTKNPKF